MKVLYKRKKRKQKKRFNQNNTEVRHNYCRAESWIVSDDLQAIYMLNAKAMSTSIKAVFGKASGFKIGRRSPHKLPLDYISIKKIICNKKKYSNYFKFSFVRNPWARLWSCYCQKSRQKIPLFYHFLQFDFRKHITWNAFVDKVCVMSDHVADMHVRSQCYTVDVISADFIGKQENANDDWKILQTHIKDLPDLPHLQPHNFKHNMDGQEYVRRYTDKQIEMVAQRYKNDIYLFDYNFLD